MSSTTTRGFCADFAIFAESDHGIDDDRAKHRLRQVFEEGHQRNRGQCGQHRKHDACGLRLGAGPVVGRRLTGAATGDEPLKEPAQHAGKPEGGQFPVGTDRILVLFGESPRHRDAF
jgi:hypothetical protein